MNLDDSTERRWLSPDPANAGADPSNPQSWDAYSYAGNNPTTNTDPSGEDYKVCLRDISGALQCTTVGQEDFQGLIADPGPLLKLSGDNGSGNIFLKNVLTGQQMFEGTYHWEPPNDAVLPNNGTFFTAATLLAGGAVGAVRDLGEAGFSALGRMLGVGGEEATPLVTAGTVTPELAEAGEVVQKAIGAVGNQDTQVANENVAREAADEFLGPGKTPALDRNTGQVVGWKSADGTKVVVGPHTDGMGPHYNFKNLTTGGNLHVRW